MYIDPINQNELTHHGILGMKWGVRHDPEPKGPRKAKKIQKDVDNTIYDIFNNITSYNTLHNYGVGLNKRTAKRLVKDSKKGTISKKALRMQNKLSKTQKELDAIKAEVSKSEAKIQSLLKEAKIGGYKIENLKGTVTIWRYPEYYTYKDVDTYKISKNK